MAKGRAEIESRLAQAFMGGDLLEQRAQLQATLANKKGFDPDTDCVEKISLNGATYEAHVTPFWGSWSTDFLHSTDIVLATGRVLERALGPHDEITCVDSVRFHQQLRSGLETYTRVLAPGEDSSSLLIPTRGKPTYTFTASTQNGNKIGMVGYDSQLAVERKRHWQNSNMRTILSRLYETGCTEHTQFRCSFQLPIPPSAKPGINYSNPSYAATVTMDTVMGFRQAVEAIGFAPKMGAALAAGFESINIPPLSFFTTTGGVIDLDMDFEKLKVGNNFAILPLTFEYQHFDGTTCGGGVYNVAIPKTEYVVRATQALSKQLGMF